jgi:hypothetical protein
LPHQYDARLLTSPPFYEIPIQVDQQMTQAYRLISFNNVTLSRKVTFAVPERLSNARPDDDASIGITGPPKTWVAGERQIVSVRR